MRVTAWTILLLFFVGSVSALRVKSYARVRDAEEAPSVVSRGRVQVAARALRHGVRPAPEVIEDFPLKAEGEGGLRKYEKRVEMHPPLDHEGFPHTLLSLATLDVPVYEGHNLRLSAHWSKLTNTDFELTFATELDSTVNAVGASWLAYDSRHAATNGVTIQANSIRIDEDDWAEEGEPWVLGPTESPKPRILTKRVDFLRPFTGHPPAVQVFLTGFDLGPEGNPMVYAKAAAVDQSGFTVFVETTGLSVVHSVTLSWIAHSHAKRVAPIASGGMWVGAASLPLSKWPLSSGVGLRAFMTHVDFPHPFSTAPDVLLGIRGFETRGDADVRINVLPTDISTTGMDVIVQTWGESHTDEVALSWVAIDPKFPAVEREPKVPADQCILDGSCEEDASEDIPRVGIDVSPKQTAQEKKEASELEKKDKKPKTEAEFEEEMADRQAEFEKQKQMLEEEIEEKTAPTQQTTSGGGEPAPPTQQQTTSGGGEPAPPTQQQTTSGGGEPAPPTQQQTTSGGGEPAPPTQQQTTSGGGEPAPPTQQTTTTPGEPEPPTQQTTTTPGEPEPPTQQTTTTPGEPEPPTQQTTTTPEEPEPPTQETTTPEEPEPPTQETPTPEEPTPAPSHTPTVRERINAANTTTKNETLPSNATCNTTAFNELVQENEDLRTDNHECEEQLENTEKDVEILQDTVKNRTDENEQLEVTAEEKDDELKEKDNEIEVLEEELKQCSEEKEGLREDNDRLENRTSTLEQDLHDLNETCQEQPDVIIICPPDTELIGDQCEPICDPGFQLVNHTCEPVCKDDFRLLNHTCVPICKDGWHLVREKDSYVCEPLCEEGEHVVNHTCVDVCPPGTEFLDGECVKGVTCPCGYRLGEDGECHVKTVRERILEGCYVPDLPPELPAESPSPTPTISPGASPSPSAPSNTTGECVELEEKVDHMEEELEEMHEELKDERDSNKQLQEQLHNCTEREPEPSAAPGPSPSSPVETSSPEVPPVETTSPAPGPSAGPIPVCPTGTHLVNGTCVGDIDDEPHPPSPQTCPPHSTFNTTIERCVCEDDYLWSDTLKACVKELPTIVCGNGTMLVNNTCVPVSPPPEPSKKPSEEEEEETEEEDKEPEEEDKEPEEEDKEPEEEDKETEEEEEVAEEEPVERTKDAFAVGTAPGKTNVFFHGVAQEGFALPEARVTATVRPGQPNITFFFQNTDGTFVSYHFPDIIVRPPSMVDVNWVNETSLVENEATEAGVLRGGKSIVPETMQFKCRSKGTALISVSTMRENYEKVFFSFKKKCAESDVVKPVVPEASRGNIGPFTPPVMILLVLAILLVGGFIVGYVVKFGYYGKRGLDAVPFAEDLRAREERPAAY